MRFARQHFMNDTRADANPNATATAGPDPTPNPSHAMASSDAVGAAPYEAPAMLSIEGSGTGPDSYPVEVGFVLPDGSSRCALIRPLAHWTHWDDLAEHSHAVPRETAVKLGRDSTQVAALLNSSLAGQLVYCDGPAVDPTWLRVLFEAAGTVPAFELHDFRELLSERENAFWHVLKRQVTTEMRLQRRRASSDAKILQRTLLRLRSPLPLRR